MSDYRISEGLIKKMQTTREFATLDRAALTSLSTDQIGTMFIECQVLTDQVFALTRAVVALEALVRKGEEVSDPFEGSIESLLGDDS
ncbi:hypothetical protein ACFVTM_13350 [Arthrobacter sp. NPDC058130]|uniref:hypothetical protein n=1 Tax=Arthrobacter sp. NPDC058130 TaxID=3346353 RepID=UPI0036E0B22D